MNRTSVATQSASNWQIFTSWSKKQLRTLFSRHRRTQVLVDPRVKIRATRQTGRNPYNELSGRCITLQKKPLLLTDQASRQSFNALGIETLKADGSPVAIEDVMSQLHLQLSSSARQAHIAAYRQGSPQELIALTRLMNQLLAKNWSGIANALALITQPYCPKLSIYVKPIHQYLAVSASTQPKKPGNTDSSWQLLSHHVDLMSGDITRINQGSSPITDTIVCPVLSGGKKLTSIQQKLADCNSMIKDKLFMKTLKKIKPGHSANKKTTKLKSLGFNEIIFSRLPDPGAANLDQQLINTYEGAIRTAHQQKKKSVAIPVISRGLPISSQRASIIVALAIKRYLQKCTWDDPPPRIHLVCPATDEGYEIQNLLKQHLARATD